MCFLDEIMGASDFSSRVVRGAEKALGGHVASPFGFALTLDLRELIMRTKTTLTAADAAIILAACKAEAAKNNWLVSIAVVDEAGYVIHVERMDGAGLPSPEVATLKARTAAIAKAPTKALEDVVKERPAVGLMPNRLPVQGGVPILHNGECVGGIGVSGVKSHEDEIIALAGREALLASVA